MKNATGVFIDECPHCHNKQEALVGYLSYCLKCGHDWRSYRHIPTQPIIRWHSWTDKDGEYNDFVPQSLEAQIKNHCKLCVKPNLQKILDCKNCDIYLNHKEEEK